ncbi:MAG: glycosyltransferase family 2 protein [Vulcanimicrobiota bacterium]
MSTSPTSKDNDFLLSLVVPVYYEEDCIHQFITEVSRVLDPLYNWEVVFIDDGSTDRTVELIKDAAASNPRIKLLVLSYNHGKEAAFTAGVNHAEGDYLLYMDPDLQDPPEEIPMFVEEIQKGYDLVFGVRAEKKDGLLNRMFSALFWWLLDKFTALKIPRNIAVMRIFNRRFANEFLRYNEANRFIEGMFMRVGMKRTTLTISQRERFAGESKFTFKRKLALALRAIFDYSELPLALATRFGMFLVILSGLVGIVLVVLRVFFIEFQIGWPSLFLTLTLGFGLQIFFMGLIGTYVGKIYLESKRRPIFSVKEFINLET